MRAEGCAVNIDGLPHVRVCHGRGSTWPEKRGYQCVMCHGENVIDVEREPEWDWIVSTSG